MASRSGILGAFESAELVEIKPSSNSIESRASMQPKAENNVRDESGESTPGKPTAENEIFIAVMGAAGSGKSSFIKTVTGADVLVGHDLTSCEFLPRQQESLP
jgi:GTPase SAR1 family protein